MNAWQGYSKRFPQELRKLRLSVFERFLLASLALMCLISAIDALSGRDPGNYEQVKMAKLQIEQEMMASRVNSVP